MYESSGSQFFRITTWIQSGLGAFDVSRLVTTFLTILGVTGILCNFRSDLEGKTGTEIPEIPVFAWDLQDLLLLRTISAIFWKRLGPSFLEMMNSLALFVYVSLAASRTLLQWLLACLNFTLDSEDFFSIWVFFHKHSRFTRLQRKGEGIYLTPLYHFHPLQRHLNISWAITAESSPLHIASSWTRTWNFWFPSASC